MPLEIPRPIIGAAVHCSRQNACLEGEERLHCTVTDLMRGQEDEYVLLECSEEDECAYCRAFYRTRICTCPVRKEIFKRYGL